MSHKKVIQFRSATPKGIVLPPGQETKIDFWPSGGHDVEVIPATDGKSIRVFFRDRGWTSRDVWLEIKGDDLKISLKSFKEQS
jgi:hypothetical protein